MDQEDQTEQYGRGFTPRDIVQVFVKGFNFHLKGPDGGMKSTTQRNQMCNPLMTIYRAGGSPGSMKEIFDKVVVYRNFMKKNIDDRKKSKSKGLSGNTLVVYLTTYEKFAVYVKNNFKPMSKEVSFVIKSLSPPDTNALYSFFSFSF